MRIFINNSKKLAFQAVFAFNMRSRHVSYWAPVRGPGRTKPPTRPPQNAEEWADDPDGDELAEKLPTVAPWSHGPAACVLKMLSLFCFLFLMSFHKNILFGFFVIHLKIL